LQKYASALPILRRAVAADSLQAKMWSDLGLAMIMTGDSLGAQRALDQALNLDSELAVAWYNRGLMHYHARRWTEAVTDLQEAARLAPGNQEITNILQRARLLEQRTQSGPENAKPNKIQ
jgi:Flp pilus assembly protein TadD